MPVVRCLARRSHASGSILRTPSTLHLNLMYKWVRVTSLLRPFVAHLEDVVTHLAKFVTHLAKFVRVFNNS